MIARRELPREHRLWNRRWHAPFGRRLLGQRERLPVGLRARVCGPFAFQRNSSIRTAEYPWAYFAAPIRSGTSVLDIGGGHGGLQFVLAKSGAKVTNVDPMIDYGSGEYVEAERLHARLNRAFRTDVRLIRGTVDTAPLGSGSFDVVYCISVIEHLDELGRQAVLDVTRRVLRPGGVFVVTVDLFLNLAPFTRRVRNRWGTNISIRELVERSGLVKIAGDEAELLGFPAFEPDYILSRLGEYVMGEYPALSQMLVLRRANE